MFDPASVFVGEFAHYEIVPRFGKRMGEVKGGGLEVLRGQGEEVFLMGMGKDGQITTDDKSVDNTFVKDLEV
jgi:hypothetical protein